MAIIIHSSDIYEKSYTPLKDNIIKTVEVPIKAVSTTYEYDTNVFNSEKSIEEYIINNISDNVQNKGDGAFITSAGTGRDERLANAVILTKKYITVEAFEIIKSRNNEHITNITSNINVEVNSKVDFYDNIDCTYNADSNTFDTTIPTTIIPTETKVQSNFDVADYEKIFVIADTVDLNNPSPYGYTLSSKVAISHTNNNENIKFNVMSGGSGAIDITIFSSDKEMPLSRLVGNSPEIIDNQNSYLVQSFDVFCGYDVSLCYAWAESQEKSGSTSTIWTTRTAKQVCYRVNPLSIILNINGDKIRLNVQDGTVQYGDTVNRKNSYKTDGNELIQSTNTYNGKNAVEKFAQDISTHYTNGKEIAEIQCSISNYYDESGKLVIGTKQYRGSYSTLITFAGIRPFQGKYMIIFNGDIANNAYAVQYSNEQVNVEKDRNLNYIIVDENSIFYKVYNENYSIIVNVLCEKLNRLFEVGDEVIPYTYTAYGEKPLSTYKNGDRKIYKVIGVQLIDEGICWQKLTIQEK